MNNDFCTEETTPRTIPSLAIVVPCHNETEAFPRSLSVLNAVLEDLIVTEKVNKNSLLYFIDDGSKDTTWQLIKEAAHNNPSVRGIKLSRNRGHQVALMAGLSNIDTDVSISIDADLQDDTGCISQMIDKYMEGNEIVYGVRNNRTSDTLFKRHTANIFYKFMSYMGVNQIENHADYRLLSRLALNSLLQYKEQNIYIRGMVPLIGFRSDKILYSRNARIEGESKYPLVKMLALATEGITSLTVTPLRLISMIGFITCILAFITSIFAVVQKIQGNVVEGWTSVMISIFFLGGIQLLCLGVIGEYIGKIYMESKGRPKFFIEETAGQFKK